MASVTKPLITSRYNPNNVFTDGHIAKWGHLAVTFQSGRYKVNKVITLIDTGAQWTVYSYAYAAALGLNLKSGLHTTVGGIGGGEDVWFHTIRLKFDKWSYLCKVGFLGRDLSVPGLLGYIGFFDRFRYSIDASNNTYTISRLKRIYKQGFY